jgi:hypothetical protein
MKREPTSEEREKIGSAIIAGDRMNCALYFGHAERQSPSQGEPVCHRMRRDLHTEHFRAGFRRRKHAEARSTSGPVIAAEDHSAPRLFRALRRDPGGDHFSHCPLCRLTRCAQGIDTYDASKMCSQKRFIEVVNR